jgi:hypothetical protein
MSGDRFYMIGIDNGSSIIGIPESAVLSIALGHGTRYSAPIERVHKAMAAWHSKEHPTGKHRRRKLLTSSEQLRTRPRESQIHTTKESMIRGKK